MTNQCQSHGPTISVFFPHKALTVLISPFTWNNFVFYCHFLTSPGPQMMPTPLATLTYVH